MDNLGNAVAGTFFNALNNVISFIPSFVSGLVILLVGWGVALLLGFIVKRILEFAGIDRLLDRAGLRDNQAARAWPNIISQIVFWFVFLTFLIPAFNAWQLTSITSLLNQFVLYIPNVFAAVVIGFVGFVLAHIAYDLVKNAAAGMGSDTSSLLANVARYALLGFTFLVALNQLQVASGLIQILFAGLVAMLAIAGGLAFGLGGQESARQLLERMRGRSMEVMSEDRRGNRPDLPGRGRQPVYAQQIRRRSGAAEKDAKHKQGRRKG